MAYMSLMSNIYMTNTLYMTCKKIICTILFDLLGSPKIILFKDFILEIIKVKVTEKSEKKAIFRDSIIFSTRSLNKII